MAIFTAGNTGLSLYPVNRPPTLDWIDRDIKERHDSVFEIVYELY